MRHPINRPLLDVCCGANRTRSVDVFREQHAVCWVCETVFVKRRSPLSGRTVVDSYAVQAFLASYKGLTAPIGGES